MKILLGLTGSVASVLYLKLITELQAVGEVEVILTSRAKHFIKELPEGVKVWTDDDEWKWKTDDIQGMDENGYFIYENDKWKKNDQVLHIDLRDTASALVIAPCSANTLGKIANGLCDNLLTSVVRAWDVSRPIILAPAMNTHMWNHPLTRRQLAEFRLFSRNNHVVNPQSKLLACNTEGMGALAEISEIVEKAKKSLQWHFPLQDYCRTAPQCSGIPQCGHPGAFLTKRKYHIHTGVDLYCNDGQPISAVEDGLIVSIEDFTGSSQKSSWWEDTKCILIEGATGVVCYGEMEPAPDMKIGNRILKGEHIGNVKRVLKPGKERPDIAGHSTSMLHMEIYKHGTYRAFEENSALGEISDWNVLVDPTPYLASAINASKTVLKP